MFTDVGFHLNSGFTKILCTPIFPLSLGIIEEGGGGRVMLGGNDKETT